LPESSSKTLRYRLLHVAARPTRGQRRLGYASTDTGPAFLRLGAAHAHRLTAKPDTTSGGSHRQKQQAGHLAMPAHTEQCRQRSTTASKISQLTRE
jgi:hypothetical protein